MGQFQGQNIGQKVITPKFTQITKMMSDLNNFSLNFQQINPHILETDHPIIEKF